MAVVSFIIRYAVSRREMFSVNRAQEIVPVAQWYDFV